MDPHHRKLDAVSEDAARFEAARAAISRWARRQLFSPLSLLPLGLLAIAQVSDSLADVSKILQSNSIEGWMLSFHVGADDLGRMFWAIAPVWMLTIFCGYRSAARRDGLSEALRQIAARNLRIGVLKSASPIRPLGYAFLGLSLLSLAQFLNIGPASGGWFAVLVPWLIIQFIMLFSVIMVAYFQLFLTWGD